MNFWFDLRYAVRLLLKKPSFTALTVGVMACGLALCIFMISFIYVTTFKPLPFENGDRMVVIDKEVNGVLHNGGQVKYDYYADVKAQSTSFEIFGAMQDYIVTISGQDNAVNYRATFAEPELFKYTKVTPIKGRLFNHSDNTPGAPNVTVIGFDLWQNYFAGREDIIGQQFFVEGNNTEIIGVMPQGYLFPRANQLWLPLRLEQSYPRGNGPLISIYGLLKPGVSAEQANIEMAQIIKRANTQYPEFNTGESLMANSFMISMMGNGVKPVMLIMLLSVVLVLVLACVNVANLLYARSTERAKETAIRVALGAPQSRLVMQMLWESLIICSLGGIFALLLAAYGLEVANKTLPTFLSGRAPFWWNITIDSSLVWLTLTLTVLTALLTGIMPARKIINGDFNGVLRDGTRGAVSRKAKRVSQALVIFEVTLSVALLTAAMVMTVAVNHAIDTDYGARTTNMLTARVSLPEQRYNQPQQRLDFFKKLEQELADITGVNAVAITTALPAQGGGYRPVLAEGFEMTEDTVPPRATTVFSMPTALDTLEYQLLQGRMFSESDNQDSELVTIVSQSFAQKLWPNQANVIGKRIKWPDEENPQWHRVIGVVGTIIHGQPFSDFKYRPSVYRAMAQRPQYYASAAITTQGSGDKLRSQLVKAFAAVDADVPAYRVKTSEQIVSRNTAGISFIINLFMLFGISSTILAGSGIYALMSNAIGQRTQEFGVRRALGSTDKEVVNMLLKQGGIQLAIGTLIGLPLSYIIGKAIITLIGVSSWQIYSVYVAIPVFITLVVLAATYIPALKVTRVQPNDALRYE